MRCDARADPSDAVAQLVDAVEEHEPPDGNSKEQLGDVFGFHGARFAFGIPATNAAPLFTHFDSASSVL